MTPAAREELTALLLRARREGFQVEDLPAHLVPDTPDEAYAIQDRVSALLGWPTLGWKIAGTTEAMRGRLRMTEPIMGRSFAQFLHGSPARLRHAALLDPIVEPEVFLRLGCDLPPRGTPWTREEVAEAVEAAHAGIEVAECRFPNARLPAPNAILADGCANGRYVLGPELPRDERLAALPVSVTVDGAVRRTGSTAEAMGDPLLALAWLANRRAAMGDALRRGMWISTGTCTGMMLARPGTRVAARFGDAAAVEVTFDA
jgi:2-keto-4-pentenoate hydratase